MDDMGEALAAAAALLAVADGGDADAVRGRLRAKAPGAVAAFDGHVAHLREGGAGGEESAIQSLHPVKGDAATAAALMESVLETGGGVDALAPGAQAAARRVAETLNLSPTRFGL
ncbi:MAG TPA: hypothetical protein VED40_03065 [Azospirillaceae bacterium]|nr:hypothetical protein [Azospirillaceae bacterium]